jgi:hypothetical protein
MKTKLANFNMTPFLATIGFISFTVGTFGEDVSHVLPAEIRQSLILYYDFASEPVAGKIIDKSGHGNDGLAVNVEFVKDGHQGGAAKFGLNDSYITVPNNEDLNPRVLTLSAWIKTSYKDRVWRRIFDKGTGKGYVLSMCGDDKAKSYRGQVDIEPGKTFSPSGIQVADGQWHQVVGTFDGKDAKVYVDGWPVGKPGHWIGEIPHTDYDLTIGANRSNPDGALGEIDASFNGMMDDVMMFNRALSADEVQTVFKAQGGVLVPRQIPAPTSEPQNKPNAAERLKQVKQLFDQGMINKEDYDKKVKEIMDSL